MENRVAIIAALPREIAALVRGVPADRALLAQGVHLHSLGRGTVVVAAGMGSERVGLAVAACLRGPAPSLLVSTGLAGSCAAALHAGVVVEPDVVVDARTGERFRTDCPRSSGMTLATVEAIASTREKQRLHATYKAALVDMEAATVARLAAANGCRFRALKGISDGHDFELASLSRFSNRHGHFRTGAFAVHTAVRPHHWPKAVRLGRASGRALAGLEQALRTLLAETDAR